MERAVAARNAERGSVAILALWGAALIGILLLAAGFSSRSELLIARNTLALTRARLAAEAGTQLGLVRLLRRHRDPAVMFDGTPAVWRDGGATVRIAIADEAGKLDINEAPAALLTGLLVAVGEPRDSALLLACNIVDRRGGVDPACPEGAGGNRPHRFAAPEELAQLPGFGDALYNRIADCVTVATGASAIDPSVAPRAVLLALPGASESLVDSYLARRATWHSLAGTDDLLKELPASPYLMASPRRDFTISAMATTADGARFRADLEIRLGELASQPYRVLAWREPPADRGTLPASARRTP